MSLTLTGAGSSGNAAVPTYAEILRDTYGASEIWPLVNISAGVAIPAFINANRNGTLTGWDLQNVAGPVPGTLAPYSDGVNDVGDIFTSNGSDGLADIWNPAKMAIFAFAKADGDSWTDSTSRAIWRFFTDASNFISMQQKTTNNTLRLFHYAGATTITRDITISTTAWFSVGVSVDIAANEMKIFINGSQEGTTITGMGTWAGALAEARIGANSTPAIIWKGHLSYTTVKFGSIWSPANFAAMHAAAATAGAD